MVNVKRIVSFSMTDHVVWNNIFSVFSVPVFIKFYDEKKGGD